MKNNSKFLFVLIAILLIGGGLIFAMNAKNKVADTRPTDLQTSGEVAGVSTTTAVSESDSSYVLKLAEYLSDKGAVMFGAYWSADTVSQKKLFGDSAGIVDYVECDPQGSNANLDECTAQNIQTYPTWVYKGQQYRGIQTLAELAKIAGFSTSQNSQ